MHRIDWTHAFTHRLSGFGLQSTAQRVPAFATRLATALDAGTLPFLDFSYADELAVALPAVLDKLPPLNHMVLLGIGGSALGARALQKAFYPQQDRPSHTGRSLWIADNIDSSSLEAWMDTLPPEQTLVVVVSKSGGTIETMAQYCILQKWLKRSLGDAWKHHLVIITDPVSGPLRQEVETTGILSLPVPNHLGGRYSALSAVGLLPAAFLGIDWQALINGAKSVTHSLADDPASLARHPAWAMATWAHALMKQNYSQLIFFSYIPLWGSLGSWFAQLWAESLGKEQKGSMPIPAVGVTDQHSIQQMFLDGRRDKGCLFISGPNLPQGPQFHAPLPEQWQYLEGKHFGDLLAAEALGTRMALVQHQVPLAHIVMNTTDENAGGALMALCMAATLFTGWLMDISPLDQPAVELGKRLANARLGAAGYQTEEDALAAFLEQENASSGSSMLF